MARAFTDRSIGFTHLTLGSNQRLEFLGDTVLQLICSEYLYRHFPEHHEGHLSLLRSSLVNNRTQSVVCDDLGMTQYAVYSNPKPDLKTKDRADLLEAFLGALYVDRGLDPCQTFCQVCLFPRLQVFIMNQDWNDPKSKLQQCCLTLRTMDGGEPDIPVYKVIECIGPTNTRVYTVAVYFRGKRLASATGHSIQQAEMNAAKAALENSRDLFPQLDHQKRVIAQSIKRQKGKDYSMNGASASGTSNGGIDHNERLHRRDVLLDDESNLPKQYRTREDISSDEMHQSDSGKSSADAKRKRSKRRKKRSSEDFTRSPPSSPASSSLQLHKRPRTEATTLMESIMQQHKLISSTSADRASSCSSIDDVVELQSSVIVPETNEMCDALVEESDVSSAMRSRLSSCSSLPSADEIDILPHKKVDTQLHGGQQMPLPINKSRLSSISSMSSFETMNCVNAKVDNVSSDDDVASVESGEIL